MKEYASIKIRTNTKNTLKVLAAQKGIAMMSLIEQMTNALQKAKSESEPPGSSDSSEPNHSN